MELKTIFGKRRNKKKEESILGLEILTDGINSVVLKNGQKGKAQLHNKKSVSYANNEMMRSLITQMITESDCQSCAITLSSGFYQLMLLDAPDVTEDELGDAMKWKIAEINNQSPNSIVVDSFKLPADAYRGRMSMCYSAVVDKTFIADLVEAVESCKVKLIGITINELSVAQLMNWMPAFNGINMVVIKPDKTGGMLCLMEGADIYLCRTLEGYFSSGNIEQEFLKDVGHLDNLALDIQRSLDYYESQLGKAGVEMGFVLIDGNEGLNLAEQLNDRLPIPMVLLKLNELFENINTECESTYASAIGAGLWGFSEENEAKN